MKKNTTVSNITNILEEKVPVGPIVPAVLPPSEDSRLDSVLDKFHPISDTTIPFRDLTSVASRKESIRRIIEKLDVIKSKRYQRTVEDTYCNVYSYDYCHFNQVYLPTIWWTEEALEKIAKGEEVEAVFNETVLPIYSSAIHDWLIKWGPSFGWKRMTDLDEIQQKVNDNGGVGIICAKRRTAGLSGHIVPIVPETSFKKAYRENGVVKYPLQSQAGKLNYNYFAKARKDWWNHERYSSHVFFYHD